MVLLNGLNYDYTNQQSTKITAQIGTGSTEIKVENTEGFANNDYFVIDPGTEKSEIIKITTVTANLTFTTAAAKFKHEIGARLYRLPYNQMKFYYCSTATGTYTYITDSAKEMQYTNIFTNYSYASGTAALYYKRTFYNATTTVESDIAEADYWQTGDEELYITPEELRTLLQFGKNDYPNPEDMFTIIKTAQRKINLDVSTSNSDILYLASFLLSKSMVMRALATKAVSKGYITINVEGRNITKAHQELVLEAENTMKEYQAFIRDNGRTEVSSTNFMNDTTIISPEVRQKYIDNWTGTQNGIDADYPYTQYYGRRSRLR